MSEQPVEQTRDDDETTLAAGAPGPSGTGEATAAGADPDAPDATRGDMTGNDTAGGDMTGNGTAGGDTKGGNA